MSAAALRVRGAAGSALLPLYAAGFVTAFGAHAVAANLGPYALGHHASLVELGVLLAVYDGAEVVLKPVFGALADRIGPKPVLLGGLIGFAAASALFVAAGRSDLLGAARLAQGAAAAAFSPAAGALIAAAGGSKGRGRTFGGYGAAKSLGYLAGPVLGGGLVVLGGYRLLFGVLAALAVAVTVLAWVRVPTADPQPRIRETLLGLGRRLGDALFLRPVGLLAGATAATSAAVGFFPVVAARAHLSTLIGGAIISVLAAVAVVVQIRAGRALDDGRLAATGAAWGLMAAAAGFGLVAALPGLPALALAAVLVGTGVGLATPAGFAGLAAAAPPGRMGQTMGAGEVGRELGDAGGPLAVAALSPLGLGAGLAGLAAILTLLATLVRPTTRHPPTEPTP